MTGDVTAEFLKFVSEFDENRKTARRSGFVAAGFHDTGEKTAMQIQMHRVTPLQVEAMIRAMIDELPHSMKIELAEYAAGDAAKVWKSGKFGLGVLVGVLVSVVVVAIATGGLF